MKICTWNNKEEPCHLAEANEDDVLICTLPPRYKCGCCKTVEIETDWKPRDGEQVLVWNAYSANAIVVQYRTIILSVWENIARFDLDHYQQSLKVDDIIKRGVTLYKE